MEAVKQEKHIILFTTNNIELEYHQDIKTLEVRWIGILDEERFKNIWQKVAEIANEYLVENILLDATYVEAAGSSAIFASTTPAILNQQLTVPNVKKIARITAGHNFYDQKVSSLYSVLLKQKTSSIEFKNFEFHYEAVDWLTGKYS